MRVLVLIIVTVFGIVASFFDAFYGLLLYTFYSFFHPLALVAYTSFKDYRTSYITALVVIFTAILQKKKIIISHKLTYLCLLFLCQCHLSLLVRNTGMSVASSFYISLLSNAIIITFITSALIEDFAKFKMYMTAAAVFLGFMGAYYGFFGVFAGATKIKGNMTGDNNAYAAWLNMSLPVIYYVGAVLKDKKWRFIFKIVFIGNILAVLLTLSRAGSITLCIVLAILVLQRMKKLLFFVIIPIGCIALFFFMPDYTAQNRDEGVNQEQDAKQDAKQAAMQEMEELSGIERTNYAYKQRMETMHNSVENIDSAVSRMHFWETAIVMANANPYFGVGLQRYKSEYNRYDRSKGDFGVERALHSTILQTMAEMGYPGFLLYILIIICYFLGIGTSKRRIRMYLNEGQEKKEFLAYLNALTIAMIAFLINSSFVNCLYFETLWAFIGVIIAAESITGKFCQQETVLQTGANG